MWEKDQSAKPNKDYIMPATLPGPEAMEVNPVTLSFSGDLEKAFLEDYYKNSLSLVRFSLLIGIFMYGFFGILDARLVPDMTEKLWTIRFAIVCPVLLAVILFSYSSHFKKYFQMAVSGAMLTAGLAIVAMISIIPPPVNYSYYAGLILVLIWGYTLHGFVLFGRLRPDGSSSLSMKLGPFGAPTPPLLF